MKKLMLLMPALLVAISSFARDLSVTEKTFMSDPFHHPMLPYVVALILLFTSIILIAFVGLYVLKVVQILGEQAEKENAKKRPATSPGWWATFAQKMNASVPVEQEKEIELHHTYDGIKELDNHLPPWWKWLFYGTIAWAAVYIIVFHFSSTLPLSLEEYQHEIAIAEEQAKRRKAAQPAEEAIDESKLEFTNDATIIAKGKDVFAANPCGSCHRNDGGGNTIGPNLTDEYWIHGGDIKSVFNTIKNGAVDKGMPAWGKAMTPQELRDLTFYVLSLQGTNPPNPKAPQGEPFKQTTLAKSDSTKVHASL